MIEGRLQERTTTDVVINVKGRMVKIPWHLVGEVRLPPAKSELSHTHERADLER